MLRLLLICLLSFASLFTVAQKKEGPLKRWAASLSIGTVPLPGNPSSLLPGIEFYIAPRLSLFNEIALQTQKNKDADSTALNKKYFRYKLEIRYYLSDAKKIVTPYFAAQYTTASRSFNVNKSWTYYDTFQEDSIYSYTKANINSPVQTLTGQFGIVIKGIQNFYFDLFAGAGRRFTNTAYTDVENLQIIINRQLFNIRLASTYRFAGKLNRLQLNLGFKVLYRF